MALRRKPKNDDIILRVPSWMARVYVMLAAVLLPWTIYLSVTLPSFHTSPNWDISWTGFDVCLIVSLGATGLFAYLRSIWVVLAAASTGSLLLADAWFDVVNELAKTDVHQALILAFVFELPLAGLSYYLASHALRHNTKPKTRKKR